ncbi:MAG: hypothetical protein EBZ58_11240, partial [Bacteroidetes bacterium]|nr:hypothetical protein [Bacteroidota bacterium]
EQEQEQEQEREITVHDIKSSGIYFSSNSDINVTIEETVNQAIIDGNSTPKTGPFSASKEGVTKENLNQKLTNKRYLNPLVDKIDEQLSPKNPTSPFKVYNAQYTKKIDGANGGLVSNTDYSDIEKKRRLFDSNYQHYMQFDFNLNQYTVSRDEDGNIKEVVKKKTSSPIIDAASYNGSDSVIMLLKKNEWFSIVFQSINIPFDIRTIPGDMVRIEFEIENSVPSDFVKGYIGPLNIFYRNFFCEYINISLKSYVKSQIVVHDIMFQRKSMLRALKQKSHKYFSKIAQLNNLARKVLYYYLKNIDERQGGEYSTVYNKMITDIETAKTKTDAIVNGDSRNKREEFKQLTTDVKKANNDIKTFSNFFKRDNIEIFRNKFFEALLRGHANTGLSAVSDAEITEVLKKMDNLEQVLKPAIGRPVHTDTSGLLTQGSISTANKLNIRTNGGSIGEGGSDYYQEGGAGEGAIFQSENYNLMIPMDIHDPGNGINDMTVRIHKIHLEHVYGITSQVIDDETSVDIKVGDAIRFVYNNNIVYAIICGFKPGKPLNDDGTDKAMDINDFRKTYIDISKTFESQKLSLTPEQFLSLTNLRGIKYLPFKYVDDTYSFVSYDNTRVVSDSLNNNIKRGLNGMFNFSCKDPVIPILPNGYVLPFTSRVKEGVSTFLDKFNPSSTKADIGKDNMLPQYSLPSYMTLEKVFVPPNFADIISSLKNFTGDNPDKIFDDLKKIMEANGLNESTDCKKTSVDKMASDFSRRQKTFASDTQRVTNLFSRFVENGKIINTKGAMQFIKNYYMKPVEPGIFIDDDGLPIRTATQLVYCLKLIPSDPIKSMHILIRALSQDGIPTLSERQKILSSVIVDSDLQTISDRNNDDIIKGGTLQSGGAENILKANEIIKGTIDIVASQKFIDGTTTKMLNDNLGDAEAVYGQNKNEDTQMSSSAMVKSGRGMGFGSGPGFGTGTGTGFGSNLLANIFKSPNRISASGKGTAIGNDSCGNNTSIVCNGKDLVVTVTLKLNELIASCMDPEIIQHLDNHPDNLLTSHGDAHQVEEHDDDDDNTSSFADDLIKRSNAAITPASPPPAAAAPAIVSAAAPANVSSAPPAIVSSAAAANVSSAAAADASAATADTATNDARNKAEAEQNASASVEAGESPAQPQAQATANEENERVAKKNANRGLGGGSTKNKSNSKKNKKSNKNKTKKRKNSTNKKIKFTKVKTL